MGEVEQVVNEIAVPAQAPAARPSRQEQLKQSALELQARLGYVQMQLDALAQEKERIVAALRAGEQVYAALEEQNK